MLAGDDPFIRRPVIVPFAESLGGCGARAITRAARNPVQIDSARYVHILSPPATCWVSSRASEQPWRRLGGNRITAFRRRAKRRGILFKIYIAHLIVNRHSTGCAGRSFRYFVARGHNCFRTFLPSQRRTQQGSSLPLLQFCINSMTWRVGAA
jgi:hypothetical protein